MSASRVQQEWETSLRTRSEGADGKTSRIIREGATHPLAFHITPDPPNTDTPYYSITKDNNGPTTPTTVLPERCTAILPTRESNN